MRQISHGELLVILLKGINVIFNRLCKEPFPSNNIFFPCDKNFESMMNKIKKPIRL